MTDEALELFNQYRDRYRVLAEEFQKPKILEREKKSQTKVQTIKFKKEEYHRDYVEMANRKHDSATHTCGNLAYPLDFSPQGRNAIQDWVELKTIFNDEQKNILELKFESIKFDFQMFEEARINAKGLWLSFLEHKISTNKDWEKFQEVQSSGSIACIAEGLPPLVAEIASSKLFKTLYRDYGLEETQTFFQIIRGGISLNFDDETSVYEKTKLTLSERKRCVSEYFEMLFTEKYYVCDHFEKSKCRICNDPFYPQSEYEWVGRVNPDYCGRCLKMAFSRSTDFFRRLKFSNEERVKNWELGVREFTNFFGFVPPKNLSKRLIFEGLTNLSVEKEYMDEAIKVAALLPGWEEIKGHYPSWAHFLESVQLLSEITRSLGSQSIASDGHHCLSFGERAICELLTKNNLIHEKEPSYPQESVLNPGGGLRADFIVGDIYIEFAGLMSRKDYKQKMLLKEELAQRLNMKWIMIEEISVETLDSLLRQILAFREVIR